MKPKSFDHIQQEINNQHASFVRFLGHCILSEKAVKEGRDAALTKYTMGITSFNPYSVLDEPFQYESWHNSYHQTQILYNFR